MLQRVKAVLVDLDGTLYVDARPIPGAQDALRRIRAADLPLRFATNTTRKPRRELLAELAAMGFEIRAEELSTAPLAAARWLRARGFKRILAFLAEATWEDLEGLTVVPAIRSKGTTEPPPVDAVLIGDLGENWTYERLNLAFRAVRSGAMLAACQKNRFWEEEGELKLDAGAFVAALEFATGVRAEILGKPSAAFFLGALQGIALLPEEVLAVGDDTDSDAEGARSAGFQAALVRTGKFHPRDLERMEHPPDLVLDTIASLPDALGLR